MLHNHSNAVKTLPGPGTLCWLLGCLLIACLVPCAFGQEPEEIHSLSRRSFRSGEEMLNVLQPVSSATRHSVVKLLLDGKIVALATIVDTNGLGLTKASEIKKGTLSCWLADDREAAAELLSSDEEDDLALIRVHDETLQPIQWTEKEVPVGTWAITPGIASTPHAIGIISAMPRRIRPPRALIGVKFNQNDAKIDQLIPGLGAEQAGLKRGDVIKKINMTEITNPGQVMEILREFREGDVVRIMVQREEETLEKDVRMALAPPDDSTGRGASSPRSRRLTGDLSQRSEGFERVIEHDTVLQPWLCGGPLVNLDAKAIGLNIARASRVTTYALPADLVHRMLDKLKTRAGISPAAASSGDIK